MFKVYSEACKNCLLSKDRIVPLARAKEIIEGIKEDQSFFICHKASMKDENICCKRFYDELGHYSQMIRICERIDMIEFVDQEDSERLPSYNEMNKNNGR